MGHKEEKVSSFHFCEFYYPTKTGNAPPLPIHTHTHTHTHTTHKITHAPLVFLLHPLPHPPLQGPLPHPSGIAQVLSSNFSPAHTSTTSLPKGVLSASQRQGNRLKYTRCCLCNNAAMPYHAIPFLRSRMWLQVACIACACSIQTSAWCGGVLPRVRLTYLPLPRPPLKPYYTT